MLIRVNKFCYTLAPAKQAWLRVNPVLPNFTKATAFGELVQQHGIVCVFSYSYLQFLANKHLSSSLKSQEKPQGFGQLNLGNESAIARKTKPQLGQIYATVQYSWELIKVLQASISQLFLVIFPAMAGNNTRPTKVFFPGHQ